LLETYNGRLKNFWHFWCTVLVHTSPTPLQWLVRNPSFERRGNPTEFADGREYEKYFAEG
jgi:hypothetical protein